MRTVRVTGLEETLTNVNKLIATCKVASKKGLITAGHLVQREAQRKTPVDLGNLKASAFTVWGSSGGTGMAAFKDSKKKSSRKADTARMKRDHAMVTAGLSNKAKMMRSQSVAVGFSAYYALYVHEDMEASHKVGQSKFLESALNENSAKIKGLVEGSVAAGVRTVRGRKK